MTHFNNLIAELKEAREADPFGGKNILQPARDAVQDLANELYGRRKVEDAHLLLLLAANVEHERYPQYEGHWDDFGLGVAQEDHETAGGLAFVEGDVCMYKPFVSPLPAVNVDPNLHTAYSVRRGGDVASGWAVSEVWPVVGQ